MITRIRLAGVWVTDQERALDFYVNKLGFRVQADETFGPGFRWLEVVPPGGGAALTIGKPAPGQEGAQVGGFANVVFTCDDIQATYRDLESKGVHFVGPPKMQPWGVNQAIFQDPDGNTFVLVDRP